MNFRHPPIQGMVQWQRGQPLAHFLSLVDDSSVNIGFYPKFGSQSEILISNGHEKLGSDYSQEDSGCRQATEGRRIG